MADRDTYKYHFKRGKQDYPYRITNDLERREQEHQRELDSRGTLSKLAAERLLMLLSGGRTGSVTRASPLDRELPCSADSSPY